MFKNKLIATLSLTICLGVVMSACTTSTRDEKVRVENQSVEPVNKRGTKLGQIAPDFELTTMKGEKVSFEGLKGKPAVLVFWSAYCVSCEEEAPHINRLAKEFGSKGVKVVGINIGESEARTQGGIKDFGIEYDVVRDEGRKVTQEYRVLGTPTVIFLDKEGVVKYNANQLPKDYAEKLNALVS